MPENNFINLKSVKKQDKLSAALRNNLQRRKIAKSLQAMKESDEEKPSVGDLYIGFMSGTSCDGVDASLVRTDGENIFEVIANLHLPYSKQFKYELKKLCLNLTSPLSIEKELTEFHIEATHKLLIQANHSSKNIKALGFHGQTIFHNSKDQFTWQIGNPHLLAQKTGINVIHDFRRRDISLGGQGAPLVPIFHKLLMQNEELPVAVINIGGVANITYIDKELLIGFDTGPGNALIDDAMNKYYNKDFDKNGEIASTGKIDTFIVSKVLEDKYFKLSYPKSLDRNAFEYIMTLFTDHSSADIVATLTHITCSSITYAIKSLPFSPKKVFLCGGGSKNKQMVEWLKFAITVNEYNCSVQDITVINNYDPDFIESQAFAYMAARFHKNLPCAFPTTTGAKQENICGCLVEC